ncbi:DNA sulfur modification protein DndD [Candidatus Rariloculus sp.]|uniref:DNA sulfur modification protein DndD n=1 Tax=Candidatus Rariloculus sp. TaxID=3101265 RepID=UPI003D141DC9
MILDEITLENFGLYAGRQTIELTPPDASKPIVLIGGLNGGGKTTLLDALQLCLFGPHAKLSNRGSLRYKDYLSRSIHEGASGQEAAVEIRFRHNVEGQQERYRIRRSWRMVNGRCREQFSVRGNGKMHPVLADNWAAQVEDYFPTNIAHLFLFDGEQVEAYASQENASMLLGSAIQNLLGLDIVDQLDKDLQLYERRKRAEKNDDALDELIAVSQNDLDALGRRSDSLRQERAALRTHSIDRTERKLEAVQQKYRRLGGAQYDQREAIEKKWSDAKQVLKDGQVALREFAAGAAPLLLVRSLLESVEKRDRREEESRRARHVAEALTERDFEVLQHLRGQLIDESTIDALEAFLTRDRDDRKALGRQQTVLDIPSEVRGDLHSLVRRGLEEIESFAESLLSGQEERGAHVEQTQMEYESIPSSHTIAELVEQQQQLKSELAKLKAEYAAMGSDIERQVQEQVRKEQALSRLLEADAKKKACHDDRARILRHSRKARSTLTTFRRAVVRRHVHRIEALVLECYQQLLRKSALVTGLSIDPDDFSLTLIGRNGKTLSPERLSAGERQLLAIALLWGLARASGRPLPTAIDTPLGRLDGSHRMHLVERYLPFASHQVVLFSTDEEIIGDYLDRLNPWIGRSYLLAYDDELGTTRIVPGYFDKKEAA